eukprot:GHVU01111734.1.p1 GENE.GHVU01111734.1~~GHVU01111734.1.p1  ORF type:complete len:123 (+),score=3.04 GHVU01111734.1:1533-1901(+)
MTLAPAATPSRLDVHPPVCCPCSCTCTRTHARTPHVNPSGSRRPGCSGHHHNHRPFAGPMRSSLLSPHPIEATLDPNKNNVKNNELFAQYTTTASFGGAERERFDFVDSANGVSSFVRCLER